MKSYRKELTINAKNRKAFLNITTDVEAALRESGIKEGLCLVNVMHIIEGDSVTPTGDGE